MPCSSRLPTPSPAASRDGEVVVEVHNLVHTFGSFVAVDHVSFEVHRGEIFGLLGPNGAGKTTTFRMLCGLLTATEGTLLVAGVDLHFARASARQRIGYVAQKFSLYGHLSVIENLEFFASAYGLAGKRRRERIDWALEQFGLRSLSQLPSASCPADTNKGWRWPRPCYTAGDPVPRRAYQRRRSTGSPGFWKRITTLAEQGVTIIVTTHFMEEAEYCDHIVILDAGQVLARGTPAEVRRCTSRARSITNDGGSFYCNCRKGEAHRNPDARGRCRGESFAGAQGDESAATHFPKVRRVWALMQKEFRQILRDPSSVAIGVVLPIMLIILFGYGHVAGRQGRAVGRRH